MKYLMFLVLLCSCNKGEAENAHDSFGSFADGRAYLIECTDGKTTCNLNYDKGFSCIVTPK